MTHFITIHVLYWHSDITKDPSFLFILLEARKTKSTSKYLNWRLTQNPSKRISKNHHINQVIMRCHEEYITIEPLLVNSECMPKQLNQNLPFETDKNTKASSFKHNWLVDIHLKQLIGMPCMLFPALHSFQLMQTYGSCTKFFKIQFSVLNRTNSHTQVDNQLPLLSLLFWEKFSLTTYKNVIFDSITMVCII